LQELARARESGDLVDERRADAPPRVRGQHVELLNIDALGLRLEHHESGTDVVAIHRHDDFLRRNLARDKRNAHGRRIGNARHPDAREARARFEFDQADSFGLMWRGKAKGDVDWLHAHSLPEMPDTCDAMLLTRRSSGRGAARLAGSARSRIARAPGCVALAARAVCAGRIAHYATARGTGGVLAGVVHLLAA